MVINYIFEMFMMYRYYLYDVRITTTSCPLHDVVHSMFYLKYYDT